jgi:hypothetical protein
VRKPFLVSIVEIMREILLSSGQVSFGALEITTGPHKGIEVVRTVRGETYNTTVRKRTPQPCPDMERGCGTAAASTAVLCHPRADPGLCLGWSRSRRARHSRLLPAEVHERAWVTSPGSVSGGHHDDRAKLGEFRSLDSFFPSVCSFGRLEGPGRSRSCALSLVSNLRCIDSMKHPVRATYVCTSSSPGLISCFATTTLVGTNM